MGDGSPSAGLPSVCLGAASDQRLACAVMKDLATAVLNVAVTRAQGATRRSYRRARHPADNRADRTSNHGSGDDARCGASCLLRRLAGRDRKTNSDCK